MPRIARCASKVVPCPAGDRCPEHRGLIKTLERAAQELDFESVGALTRQLAERNTTGKVRRNTKGETIVSLITPALAKQVQHQLGTTTLTVTAGKPQRREVNLGVLTAADVIDKDRRMFFDVYNGADITRTIQETYGPGVDASFGHQSENATIESITLPPNFEGKGVERHIVESFLAGSRNDARFGLAEGVLSDTEALDLDFQPNPFYWAGRTHPVTGHVYPTREQLDKFMNRSTRVNRADPYGHHYGYTMHVARDLATYPYIRPHLFTIPFEALDWGRRTPMTDAERERITAYTDEREARWNRRRQQLAGWVENPVYVNVS